MLVTFDDPETMLKHLVDKLFKILPVFILLISCGSTGKQEITTYIEEDIEDYPASMTTSRSKTAYPVGSDNEPGFPSSTIVPESYPHPIETEEVFKEPRFQIDLPIVSGNTVVSGQSPPNMALAIVDITYNGYILGTGRSGAGGDFSISVISLPEGHRVGISIAELEPGQTFNEMAVELHPHRGEGFMNIPNVGVFFDTAMVQP